MPGSRLALPTQMVSVDTDAVAVGSDEVSAAHDRPCTVLSLHISTEAPLFPPRDLMLKVSATSRGESDLLNTRREAGLE